jgi:hypothetical protein
MLTLALSAPAEVSNRVLATNSPNFSATAAVFTRSAADFADSAHGFFSRQRRNCHRFCQDCYKSAVR